MKNLNRMFTMAFFAAAFVLATLTSAFAHDPKPSPTPTNTRPSGAPTGQPQVQIDPTKRFERLEALAKQQGDEIAALKKENVGLKIRLAVVEPSMIDSSKGVDKVNLALTQIQGNLSKIQVDLAGFHNEYKNHAHSLNFEAAEDPANSNVWFVKLQKVSKTNGYIKDTVNRKDYLIATGFPEARTSLLQYGNK